MKPEKVLFYSLAFLVGNTSSQECLDHSNPENCHDTSPPDASQCQTNAYHGLCVSQPSYMFKHCASQCIESEDFGAVGLFSNDSDHAVTGSCVDSYEYCEESSINNECQLNPEFMLEKCAKSCKACFPPGDSTFDIGVRQRISEKDQNDTERIQTFVNAVQATHDYMAKTVMVENDYAEVRLQCYNEDEFCTTRAMDGECDEPDGYEDLDEDDPAVQIYEAMISNCSPACQTCQELVFSDLEREYLAECTPDLETNIFEPGDLNKTFRRIVREIPFEEGVVLPDYKVNIHSRPLREGHKGKALDSIDYHIGPWIVTLDNFITDEECDRLIELGGFRGYDRSLIENEEDEEDDEDPYRTSRNTWCQDECSEDPFAQSVTKKIENLTGIPTLNSEYLQLLKYDPGQFYKSHHDWSYDHNDAYHNPGPRMITVFLYLNEIEEGGATRFTDIFGNDSDIYIDVKPKKGTALIWPSVRDDDLMKLEDRTFHEALVVEKGVKYGANAWLHLRDFRTDDCDYEVLEGMLERLKLRDEED